MCKLLVTAFNAQAAIYPEFGHGIGGLETFAWSLAQGVARTGRLSVSISIRTDRRLSNSNYQGVELQHLFDPLRFVRLSVARDLRRQTKFPGFSIRHWNPNLVWQIPLLAFCKMIRLETKWPERVARMLASVDPDVILCLGVNQDSAAVVHVAQRLQIPVIVWLQSNGDLDKRFFVCSDFRNEYGVTSADGQASLCDATRIVCQTEWQRSQAAKLTTRPTAVIRNPVDSSRFHPRGSTFEARQFVAWVGRYDEFHKRPLLALEVAQHCPDIPFRFVINPGNESVKEQVQNACPPNVSIQEYLPNDQMPELFRSSRVFLSTGSGNHEGFPNVFLEAAASGTPICSLEDFDRFLELSNAGKATDGDVSVLARWVQRLWNQKDQWQRCSEQGLQYVRKHHELSKVVEQFVNIVEETHRDASVY